MSPVLRLALLLSGLCLGLARLACGAAEPGALRFETDVRPFLTQHCVKCHGERKQAGKLALHQLDGSLTSEKAREIWARVAEKLWLGEMPPEDEPHPSPHASGRVVNWLTAEFARAGHRLVPPPALELPGGGNRVSHETLFTTNTVPGTPPPATAARLWRISPQIYDELLRSEVGKNARGVTQPFSTLTGEGFKDFASGFTVDEPTTSLLLRNADAIVAAQTRFSYEDGKFKGAGNTPRELVSLMDTNAPPTDAQIRAALERQFKLVLRREPTAEERTRFTAFMRRNIADSGQVTGVRTALAAVLLLPEAIFRIELGAGKPDAHGRRLLSPRELAGALSFALTDRPPDRTLQGALDKGQFAASRESAANEVRRMLADDSLAKPRILRFFREFFGYPHATEVFKDDKENKDHEARVLVSDTDRLVEFFLAQDRDVFRELLTTRKAFVNFAVDTKKKTPKRAFDGKKDIHRAYGLPAGWSWTAEQPVELDGQHAGILTQPSWLVAFSMNFDNHPITRGKWVRERLLGGTVPDLPITVDAQLPNAPEQTLRQRLEGTKAEYCWQCHQRMNPLGMPFEAFDHFGRARTTERVQDKAATAANVDKKGRALGPVFKEAPLNTRSVVALTGDARLDGEVADPLALIHKLAGSERVRQVFVRHAFRYWLGRNETLADAPVLQAADQAYVGSGGSFKALLVSLLTSDAFLYRVNPASPTASVTTAKP
ncbi:MAG: DUF1588 domain-containing protein [Proteobacteria bacterium]|nr:DUF1588 domain-containing protein [Pseudomonadota bacterium]